MGTAVNTEHSGLKNGGGNRGTREEANITRKKERREIAKVSLRKEVEELSSVSRRGPNGGVNPGQPI